MGMGGRKRACEGSIGLKSPQIGFINKTEHPKSRYVPRTWVVNPSSTRASPFLTAVRVPSAAASFRSTVGLGLLFVGSTTVPTRACH